MRHATMFAFLAIVLGGCGADTLNWQTIFGSTLYPFPGHSAYYLQEETAPVSNGVYICTAAAPAGTPNCQ